jgi:hypothetical protein
MGPPAADYGALAGMPGGEALVSTHVAQVPGEPPGFLLYRLQAHRWGGRLAARAQQPVSAVR